MKLVKPGDEVDLSYLPPFQIGFGRRGLFGFQLGGFQIGFGRTGLFGFQLGGFGFQIGFGRRGLFGFHHSVK